jgi:catechol 2,3-dioxygenase-like lactoylglutathione lyase family enzyme
MTQPSKPHFQAGRNIALKTPPHAYEATVRFYGEVLGLPQIERLLPNVCFEFGDKQLWIDRVPALSRSELWLEITTDDHEAAARHFEEMGIVRCDAIEPLPPGHKGFWIMDPASTVCHVVVS